MEQTINFSINFLFYVSIPLIIRYIILRRPLNNKWIAFVILIPVFIGFSMLISEQKKQFYQESGVNYKSRMIGSPLLYSSMIGSYFILCGSFKRKREADKKNNSDNDDADKLTNSVIHKKTPYNEISSNTAFITGNSELKSVPAPQAKPVSQKTHEVDSYFDFEDGNIINSYTNDYDNLEKNWSVAIKYYNDLEGIDSRLSKISNSLSYKFRINVLKEKLFNERQKIADDLEYKFFKHYFGENKKIIDFATYLVIVIGNKKAAKSLSEAVRVLANTVDDSQIIRQIKYEFRADFKRRLKVIGISEQSEAERVGIKMGDVLYSYYDAPISSNNGLTILMEYYKGQQHTLKVIRGRQQLDLYVTAGLLGIVAKETNDEY